MLSAKKLPRKVLLTFVAVQSKTIFIITILWLIKGYWFKIKCFAWQERQHETHLLKIVYENLIPQCIWRSNTASLNCLTHIFLDSNYKNSWKRTYHVIEQLSKDRTYFSIEPFFLLYFSKRTSERQKGIMEMLSHLCSACSKNALCTFSTFYFKLINILEFY